MAGTGKCVAHGKKTKPAAGNAGGGGKGDNKPCCVASRRLFVDALTKGNPRRGRGTEKS